MQSKIYDVCIIGGGINGAGVARDAAGRGLSVVLAEAGDLGGMTSSASSKMLHGGLRYLEYGELGLVREALAERETILNIAPHIARPMDFILPQGSGGRPAWMIKAGLFLYDHLAGRKKLKASGAVALEGTAYGKPLRPGFKAAFRYSDGQVDDARLVVLNAVSAQEMGAEILTYTACTHIEADEGIWTVLLQDKFTGAKRGIKARAIVNAAGPMADKIFGLEKAGGDAGTGGPAPRLRLVKGSHIVVKRLYEGDHAYIFQNPDKRVIFLWPFEGYTLVGTTEEDYDGNPREAKPSAAEIDYLCQTVNRVCRTALSPADVLYSFSGVRPLIDSGRANASSVSRRHSFHDRVVEGGARMISIYGGKLTTYRLIAEEVVDKLVGGARGRWTHGQALPGGDIPSGDIEAFAAAKVQQYVAFDAALVRRYARLYGTRIDHILGLAAGGMAGLGAHYGDGIYEAELRYAIRREFVRTTKDFLWRRTKLDLSVAAESRRILERDFPALLKTEGVKL